MQNVTGWSIAGLSALLMTAGACHKQHHAHHAGDLDGDHDEHVDERRAPGHHEGHHEGNPELGSGIKAHHAVHSIARARCEREEHCGNVGAGKDYASVGACEEKIRTDWQGDLNKYECPAGINEAALDKCLADVRTESCGNPFDTLSRVVSCNSSDICKN